MTVRKATILHADDVARWRRHVGHLLSGEYEVRFAEDFEGTLAELGRGRIDLLILDHLMPGTYPLDDACAVCAHLRAIYPDLSMIVYTGAWQAVEVDRAEIEARLGAPVVFKDVRDPQKDDLLARVREVERGHLV